MMPAFLDLDKDLLASLLKANTLNVKSEEFIFEAVVRWMDARRLSAQQVREEECPDDESLLLREIRFSLMDSEYLSTKVLVALPESTYLKKLVPEALAVNKSLKVGADVLTRQLERQPNVDWCKYASKSGGEKKVEIWDATVCVVLSRDTAFIGTRSGRITVIDRSTLEIQKSLDEGAYLRALAVHGNFLISASDGSSIKIRNIANPDQIALVRVLQGHSKGNFALAVNDQWLAIGGRDGVVRVWKINGYPSEWQLEYELKGDANLMALEMWGTKVAAGYLNSKIRVWDLLSGSLEQVLTDHGASVDALVQRDGKLMSTGADRVMKIWSTESWKCLQSQVIGSQDAPAIRCAAFSGSKLAGGSCEFFDPFDSFTSRAGQLHIWDWETLETEFIFRHQGARVRAIAADRGELWACIDKYVAVWK